MEKLTEFAMKNSLTLPSLAYKYFNNLGNENDETFYTYNNEYISYFVRKSLKGDRCVALNQNCKISFSDKVFNSILTELENNGNICEILDKYFQYVNKWRMIFQIEYKSRFEDFRDFDQGEKAIYVNDKLSKLPIQ